MINCTAINTGYSGDICACDFFVDHHYFYFLGIFQHGENVNAYAFIVNAKMDNIASRLKIIMGDMSCREFSARLEKSPTTVNKYLKGRVPPADFIEIVCSRFSVRSWWLLTGEGTMKQDKKQPGLCRADRELMVQTIAVLEGFLKTRGLELDPDRRGKVTVKLFENLQNKSVAPDDVDSIEKETEEMMDLILPGKL